MRKYFGLTKHMLDAYAGCMIDAADETHSPTHALARAIAREWILELKSQTGLELTNLARHAGLNQSTVTRPVNDPTNTKPITAQVLRRLSEAFGKPLPANVLEHLDPGRPRERTNIRPARKSKASTEITTPVLEWKISKDVPIWGSILKTPGTPFELNREVVAYAPRLPGIIGAKAVFAIRMPDESMSPWRQPDEYIYVDANRPVKSGDHVLIEYIRTDAPKSDLLCVFAQFRNGQYWQYGPRAYITDRITIAQRWRILEWAECVGM